MPEPVSTPAPESTASIVEAAVADLPDSSSEGGGYGEMPGSGDDSSHTPELSTSGNEPTNGAPVTQEERDELAEALGIADAGKAKWTQRIAYSKVAKVVKDQQAKLKADHDAALRDHQTRQQQYEAVERLITEQPEVFVQQLVAINPAYGQFLAGAPAARSTQPHAPAATERPAPDVRLADGSMTYSVDGLQRLLDWNSSQAEQRITQRLQPFEQERQSRQAMEAAVPRVKQQLADAEKWPMFTESKAEILAVLQADPRVDLTAAYQRVVLPKLAANRDQIRQDVLRELAARPHSTVAGSSVAGSRTDDAGPQDTADIIRQALRGVRN